MLNQKLIKGKLQKQHHHAPTGTSSIFKKNESQLILSLDGSMQLHWKEIKNTIKFSMMNKTSIKISLLTSNHSKEAAVLVQNPL